VLGKIARGYVDCDEDYDGDGGVDDDDDDPFHLSSYISQRSIPSIYPSIHVFIHSFINIFTHTSIYPFHSTCTSIHRSPIHRHLSIHSLTYHTVFVEA
jgi:hypothetical protein